VNRIYFHTRYERIWHWLQAASILALLMTGLAIHFPDFFGLIDFSAAVTIHNLAGFVLIGNAFLALFYHLVTGEIRQYVPNPQECFERAVIQARYYTGGIFRGEPHPFPRTPEAKFSPLQKLAYLFLLNVLLPLQAVLGLLLWGSQRWPGAVEMFGGLPTLAVIHTAVAWLFAAFLLGHLYMITTGPTPMAYLRGMVSGWEDGKEVRNTKSEIPSKLEAPNPEIAEP